MTAIGVLGQGGSKWDEYGVRIGGPAPSGLPSWEIRVQGSRVHLGGLRPAPPLSMRHQGPPEHEREWCSGAAVAANVVLPPPDMEFGPLVAGRFIAQVHDGALFGGTRVITEYVVCRLCGHEAGRTLDRGGVPGRQPR